MTTMELVAKIDTLANEAHASGLSVDEIVIAIENSLRAAKSYLAGRTKKPRK